ncbi:MAG: hypothetical protein ACWA5Q_02465 [bacterium]
MNTFDVYFLGKVMEGENPEEVKEKIGKHFKVFGDKLDHMFSGHPVRIKADVDVTLAGKFRQIFREFGALVEIVTAGETLELIEKAHQEKSAATSDQEAFELLPAHTGTLLDIAPKVEPIPIPDTIDFGLSPPGALIPEAQPDSPLEVRLDHMETVPFDAGDFDDLAKDEEELVVPDISHLQANDPGGKNLADDLPQKPAQPIPDISHIDAAPANTGSLEDCVEEKEPVEIPDISSITFDRD